MSRAIRVPSMVVVMMANRLLLVTSSPGEEDCLPRSRRGDHGCVAVRHRDRGRASGAGGLPDPPPPMAEGAAQPSFAARALGRHTLQAKTIVCLPLRMT